MAKIQLLLCEHWSLGNIHCSQSAFMDRCIPDYSICCIWNTVKWILKGAHTHTCVGTSVLNFKQFWPSHCACLHTVGQFYVVWLPLWLAMVSHYLPQTDQCVLILKCYQISDHWYMLDTKYSDFKVFWSFITLHVLLVNKNFMTYISWLYDRLMEFSVFLS